MNWEQKRVFVSGGAGVIGRELVARLAQRGATIFVGDLKERPAGMSPQVRYRQGDLNFITSAELDGFGPNVFIHLAATFERSEESYEFWEQNFQHNVRLSHHLMTLLKDSPSLASVVFASSYLIYDPQLYTFDSAQSQAQSLHEDAGVRPRNLTGDAKLSHEIELRFLTCFREFLAVNARIFRGYGKGSRCVISRWVRALLNGEAIQVFRPEGLFDYVYAGDIAEALLRLAASKTTGTVNVGSGRARSVQELVDILRGHFPNMIAQEMDTTIAFEASQADVSKLEKNTGWATETTLEEGIARIIAYERANASLLPTEPCHVLVTSANRKVPLLRSLRQAAQKLDPRIRLFAGDLDPQCLASHFVDQFWEMSPIADLSTERLVEWCSAHGVKAIIPTRDGELAYFSARREQLHEAGIGVMISSSVTVQATVDKLSFFSENEVSLCGLIPTYTDVSHVKADRIVVKERFGAGSKSIGLDLSREQAMEHAETLASAIFQPFVAGHEYSVDFYVSLGGTVKGVVVRSRDIVVDGESQVTTTVNHQGISELAHRFATSYDFYGHIILQVIEDNESKLHIVECNCRFGGASTLAISAGLDSFYWFLLEASGADLGDYPFHPVQGQLRQIRSATDSIELVPS